MAREDPSCPVSRLPSDNLARTYCGAVRWRSLHEPQAAAAGVLICPFPLLLSPISPSLCPRYIRAFRIRPPRAKTCAMDRNSRPPGWDELPDEILLQIIACRFPASASRAKCHCNCTGEC